MAKAAIDSGVATHPITDWDGYVSTLKKRLGLDNKLIKNITEKARRNPKKVVFAEADNYKILKAAYLAYDEGIAYPILLGNAKVIKSMIQDYSLDFGDAPIIDPRSTAEEYRRSKY